MRRGPLGFLEWRRAERAGTQGTPTARRNLRLAWAQKVGLVIGPCKCELPASMGYVHRVRSIPVTPSTATATTTAMPTATTGKKGKHCPVPVPTLWPHDQRAARSFPALSRGRLPLVQQHFDARALDGQTQEPPATEKEKGCLKRAWDRFGQRLTALTTMLGQLMQIRIRTPKLIWSTLRRLGNLPAILRQLAQPFNTSLLHDYRCLQPWRRRTD